MNSRTNVNVSIDMDFVFGASESKYDLVYNPDDYSTNGLYKVLSVTLENETETKKIAMIGDYLSSNEKCIVQEEDRLILLQNDVLNVIDLQTGALKEHIILDNMGCNFEIYAVKDGYVIYGEEEISMLDRQFRKKWGFCGRDIFISISGRTPFELRKRKIKLSDFHDNYYEIDYNGNVLVERERERRSFS